MNILRNFRLCLSFLVIAGLGGSSLSAMKNLISMYQLAHFSTMVTQPEPKYTREEIALSCIDGQEYIDTLFLLLSDQLRAYGWSADLETRVKELFDGQSYKELEYDLRALRINLVNSNKQLQQNGWSAPLEDVLGWFLRDAQASDLLLKTLTERFDDCSWEALAILRAFLLKDNNQELKLKLQCGCSNYLESKRIELDEVYEEQACKNKMTQPYVFLFLLGEILKTKQSVQD